ncbi:MAG TPA: guanylate kinase, partial [Candidatus Binatia bacterium]|nr:guanylate kinase [Candidatus Binatia bacterium]
MHNIIILSGPSGCGKSTLIRKLLGKYPELNFSVSHTTRSPRPGEIDGREYHFVSLPVFRNIEAKNGFVEWAEVHGQCYGTSWQEIRRNAMKNRTLVLDLDVQGTRRIKGEFPEAQAIFVVPPSLAELKKRLLKRELKWSREMSSRLRTALNELGEYKLYDHVIVNRDLEKAFSEL